MTHLLPCPSCSRHARASERECPFADKPSIRAAAPPPPELPKTRLGRAAAFAFGASVVGATTLIACGGETTGGSDGGKAGAAGTSSATGGGGSTGQGGTDNLGGTFLLGGSFDNSGPDAAGVGPVYGAPPFPEDDDGGAPVPIYGAAPSN